MDKLWKVPLIGMLGAVFVGGVATGLALCVWGMIGVWMLILGNCPPMPGGSGNC